MCTAPTKKRIQTAIGTNICIIICIQKAFLNLIARTYATNKFIRNFTDIELFYSKTKVFRFQSHAFTYDRIPSYPQYKEDFLELYANKIKYYLLILLLAVLRISLLMAIIRAFDSFLTSNLLINLYYFRFDSIFNSNVMKSYSLKLYTS